MLSLLYRQTGEGQGVACGFAADIILIIPFIAPLRNRGARLFGDDKRGEKRYNIRYYRESARQKIRRNGPA